MAKAIQVLLLRGYIKAIITIDAPCRCGRVRATGPTQAPNAPKQWKSYVHVKSFKTLSVRDRHWRTWNSIREKCPARSNIKARMTHAACAGAKWSIGEKFKFSLVVRIEPMSPLWEHVALPTKQQFCMMPWNKLYMNRCFVKMTFF